MEVVGVVACFGFDAVQIQPVEAVLPVAPFGLLLEDVDP